MKYEKLSLERVVCSVGIVCEMEALAQVVNRPV